MSRRRPLLSLPLGSSQSDFAPAQITFPLLRALAESWCSEKQPPSWGEPEMVLLGKPFRRENGEAWASRQTKAELVLDEESGKDGREEAPTPHSLGKAQQGQGVPT